MSRTHLRNERGGMMIIMAFAVVVMTVCGLTAYYLATTELTESGTKFEKAKALYLAEGGIQRAIAELSSGVADGWDDEIAGLDGEQGTDDDGILSFGPRVDCSAFKNESVTDNRTLASSGWGKYIGHYDVRISDARRPGQETGACNKVILSSTGVSSKDCMKRVEAEIEVFDMPLPPALVFMVGRYNEALFPDPDFNGQAFSIDGNDWLPDATPGSGPSVPGIGSNGVATSIIGALKNNQKDQVRGTGYDASTSPITPSIQQVDLQVNLISLAQKLKSMADNTVAPGTYAGFTGYGTPDDYQITFCDGDLHLSGQVQGCGILVVTGDFDMSGQGEWDGYIICLNHARIVGGGSGFHLFGCLMIGNSSGLDYLAEFDICGASDMCYSVETIEKAREDVRTVQINYWRSVAVK